MNFETQIPQIFALTLALLAAGGLATLLLGKALQKYATWFVGMLLFLLALLLGWGWIHFAQSAPEPQSWLRGWILPHDEQNAVTVGILLDGKALLISTIAVISAGLVLMNGPVLNREAKPEKPLSAIAMSTAGVVLAWLSLTPWLAFCGILLAVSGGFVAQGSHWYVDGGSDSAVRFAWEKYFGFGLSWLGACVLAGINTPLVWLGAVHGSGDWIGSLLLIAGLFVQLQGFPFLGWLLSVSDSPPLLKVFLNQIMPAWAALAIAVRMEPQFRELGVFPLVGWFSLSAAVLTSLVGLFASIGRQSLGLWISAGFSFSLSVIAIAGVLPGTALFIGVGLGALGISAATSSFDFKGNRNQPNLRKMVWAKSATVASVLVGTGFMGSVAAAGLIQALAHTWANTGALLFIAGAFLVFVMHGWKIGWIALKIRGVTDTSWYVIGSPFVFVLLGLGVFWFGTVTAVAPGDSDRVIAGLFTLIGSRPDELLVSETAQVLMYFSVWILGFVIAFWMGGREADSWSNLRGIFPRFSKFLLSGYRIQEAGETIFYAIQWVGNSSERVLEMVTISGPIFRPMANFLAKGAQVFARMDERGGEYFQIGMKKALDLPARGLQYLQSGDVQRYLLLGFLSMLAIVAYFLNT